MSPKLKSFSLNFFYAATIYLLSMWLLNLNHSLELPQIKISKEKESLNFNDAIIHFNGGLNRFITSIMWIKTLIDSDHERDPTFDENNNSWLFYRFLTIAKLEPQFIENYRFGGKYLSIIKDDLYGAEKIYLLGLKYYPDDYDLNYNLAFLYYSELNTPLPSIPLLIKIQDAPNAPVFIKALIASLMMKGNVEKDLIIEYIENAKKQTDQEHLILRYEAKLKELRSQK